MMPREVPRSPSPPAGGTDFSCGLSPLGLPRSLSRAGTWQAAPVPLVIAPWAPSCTCPHRRLRGLPLEACPGVGAQVPLCV